MSNHHCGDACNAAVQTALDSCIAWTSTLGGDQNATHAAAAAETCMKHEQLAKVGRCRLTVSKRVFTESACSFSA